SERLELYHTDIASWNTIATVLVLSDRSECQLYMSVKTKEVYKLACDIAGKGATAEFQDLARHVAQAQLDLHRVRLARHQFLSRALSEPDRRKLKVAMKIRGKALPALLDPRARKSMKRAILNSPPMDSPHL